MAHMTLSSITIGTAPKPPRIVVYGPHGIGKTTFGAGAPSPVFIRTEDGLATLPVPTFPIAKSNGDVIAALNELYTQDHPFQSVILDSADWLEPLIWSHVALLEGKDSIEDIPYGKGYIKADEHWGAILDGLTALRDKGMTVIILAHAEIKRFDAPDSEPYDRYQIKLHKRAAALLQEWADVVAMARYEVHTTSSDAGFNRKVTRGVGAGRRLLAVEERPAHQAKNRYRLPAELPLSWDAFAAACSGAYTEELGRPALAALAPATPEVPEVPEAPEALTDAPTEAPTLMTTEV